jgi:hypothetical protein
MTFQRKKSDPSIYLFTPTVIYFKMATPSNVNKTINDEKITPDAKRVKLFSGPDGEKMVSINESISSHNMTFQRKKSDPSIYLFTPAAILLSHCGSKVSVVTVTVFKYRNKIGKIVVKAVPYSVT